MSVLRVAFTSGNVILPHHTPDWIHLSHPEYPACPFVFLVKQRAGVSHMIADNVKGIILFSQFIDAI